MVIKYPVNLCQFDMYIKFNLNQIGNQYQVETKSPSEPIF